MTHRAGAYVVLVAVLLAVPFGVEAQKRVKATLYPTAVEFAASVDGNECGICAVAGQYLDGIDGVSSYRVEGDGTTGGWVWDLAARRTTDPRMMTFKLTRPFEGSSSWGDVTVHDAHGQIYDLSTMAPNETRSVRASFHFFVNRVEYVIRFGQVAGDGSSALMAARTASGFEVKTDGPNDLALLFRGNGPGGILLGTYHLPLAVTLENQ